MAKNVVLYSGGFDSTVLLLSLIYDYNEKPEDIIALNINYGQRNEPELYVARYITSKYGIAYDNIDISSIANKIFEVSALVNKEKNVDINLSISEQPNTYVPNRNMIFLSIALAYAETIGANYVYTAIQPHHKYYYWDATSMFVTSMNTIIRLNPYKLEIKAPFKSMPKRAIYNYAKQINIPEEILEITWSCYNPVIENNTNEFITYKPCGKCGACQERKEFFPQRGIKVNIITGEIEHA